MLWSGAVTVTCSTILIVFAGTFDEIPPPTMYLIVKVTLDGAIPYDLENKKLDGS